LVGKDEVIPVLNTIQQGKLARAKNHKTKTILQETLFEIA